MKPIEIVIAFIATILGLSYPVILDVIVKLDERYSPVKASTLFLRLRVYKIFKWLLYVTLALILYWIFRKNDNIYYIMDNKDKFVIWILLSSTIFLIVTFFFLINKLIKFLSKDKFIEYLMNQHDENFVTYRILKKTILKIPRIKKGYGLKKEKEKEKYFLMISDFLLYSLRNQDRSIEETIARFMYGVFDKYREMHPGKPFPTAYYNTIYTAMEELASNKTNKLKLIEHRISSLIWLLGEFSGTKINEDTYRWMWRILRIPIDFGNDDMILFYWETADQYYRYDIGNIIPNYGENLSITNKEEITRIKVERKRFLEFNYVLGGLLLFEKRYECLGRIFKYTTSIPPDYALLPKTMNEVFEMFFHFQNPMGFLSSFVSHKYSFPKVEGLHADGTIKKWIQYYCALLFLRQFTLYSHMIIKNPTEYPDLPKRQDERKLWIDSLVFFEKLVGEILENKALLSAVEFDIITKRLNEQDIIKNPTLYIKNIEKELKAAYNQAKFTQGISLKNKSKFLDSTKRTMVETFKESLIINNKNLKPEGDTKSFLSVGQRTILEKSAFADFQEADHLNYDTFLADACSEKHKRIISENFHLVRTKSYLLQAEDIFRAVDRLSVNGKDFVIINFGINLYNFINNIGVENLTNEKYKNIYIVSLKTHNYSLIGNSLFIIKYSDLPFIEFKEVNEEEIKKYDLVTLDEEFKIYANVIDLYEEKYSLLREELSSTKKGEDINTFVLAVIAFKVVFNWKRAAKCVQLREFSKFEEKGLPDKLDHVGKF